jgi:HAD superfamily hydrolase (TIGR01509 family)
VSKLIIFDLDGVLIDSKDLHFDSLNAALSLIDKKYIISRDEHLSVYDGLSTSKKLELLSQLKNLPNSEHYKVWQYKQSATVDLIKNFKKDKKLINIFKKLKELNYQIAVASNSIRETVKHALISIGVIEFVDYTVSNQDVSSSKPFPEMYWKCMTALKCLPKDTIIIEDSFIGRQAATDSGCHLLAIKNTTELTWETIKDKLSEVEHDNKNFGRKWKDAKLNVLIPMAGGGTRFANAGYTLPKPLIDVNGKPMIEVVCNNLNIDANYIFLVQKEHYEKYNLNYLLNLIAPNCKIVQIDGLTEGAACTTLFAKKLIDNKNPLIMANSDQYVEWNSNECMYSFYDDKNDGGIVTFEAKDTKWSYAKVDENGFVAEVAEKKVISNDATVGIYYWKHGSDYVKYAERMISKNIRVNNEFYVCPVFNQAIADGKKIKAKRVEKMWGIGTPEDLEYFLNNYKG